MKAFNFKDNELVNSVRLCVVRLRFCTSDGTEFHLNINANKTILELKNAIAVAVATSADLKSTGRLRLFYKCKVLSDNDASIDSIGFQEDCISSILAFGLSDVSPQPNTYYCVDPDEDWNWDAIDEIVARLRRIDYQPIMPPGSLSIGELPCSSQEGFFDHKELQRLSRVFCNNASKQRLAYSLYLMYGIHFVWAMPQPSNLSLLPSSVLATIHEFLLPQSSNSSGCLRRGVTDDHLHQIPAQMDIKPASSWKPSCNFRLVCKEFRNCALLPRDVGLAWRFFQTDSEATVMMCNQALDGLCRTLRLPQNRNTKLHLDICPCEIHVTSIISPFDPNNIPQNLVSLSIPISLQGIISDLSGILVACLCLKTLTLVLTLQDERVPIAIGELHSQWHSSCGERLRVLHFHRSVTWLGCFVLPLPYLSPLDLSFLPGLLDLTFKGPLVFGDKEDGDGVELNAAAASPQLIFASDAKVTVTVDPGLEGRTPTKWARSIKSGNAIEMASPLPLAADYHEEDQEARESRIASFVADVAKACLADGRFGHFDSNLEAAIHREVSRRLRAELEDARWSVNVIGLIVPLGRSDLLDRLDNFEIFDEMMEGIYSDVAAEVQAKLNSINEMKAWLGMPLEDVGMVDG